MREITHSYLSTLGCCFAVVRANGFSTCTTWSSCKLLEARAKVRLSRSRLSSWSSIVTHKSDKSMAQHGLCKTNCLQKLLKRGSWGFNPPLPRVAYLDELVLEVDEESRTRMVHYHARKCEMRGHGSRCVVMLVGRRSVRECSSGQAQSYTTLLVQKLVENRDSWTQTMTTVMQAIEYDIELC
jgi:hypothetical protein